MHSTKLFDLTGKVALVTGGTRGIGEAMAKGLKEAGAKVWIHGTNEEVLERIAKEKGYNYCVANLKDISQIDAMIERISKVEDKLDILINNAGYEAHSSLEEANEEYLDGIYNVNAKSPYFIIQKLLPLLKKANGASIINVTSIHEVVPVRENTSYCMSKAALAMYTKVAALELAKYNIRVNNLAPGAIRTDMNKDLVAEMDFDKWIPLGRVGDVSEMIGPTIFLASAASSYMTGATLFIDGGYKENLLRY